MFVELLLGQELHCTLTLQASVSPNVPQGCILMGQEEWDCARTLAGRPALGSEMGPGVGRTPLEAGLYHAVNLGKTLGSAGVQTLATAEAAGKGSQLWGLELEVRGCRRGGAQVGREREGRIGQQLVRAGAGGKRGWKGEGMWRREGGRG